MIAGYSTYTNQTLRLALHGVQVDLPAARDPAADSRAKSRALGITSMSATENKTIALRGKVKARFVQSISVERRKQHLEKYKDLMTKQTINSPSEVGEKSLKLMLELINSPTQFCLLL